MAPAFPGSADRVHAAFSGLLNLTSYLLTPMHEAIGHKIWAIPEGFIPSQSHGPAPALTSHEALCVLNTGLQTAHLEITVFFTNRDPVGPYHLSIDPRRTQHFRLNDFSDPAPIPRDTPYATLVLSSEPVVVQYTRLDSRQAENALLSTMAFPVG